MTSPTLALTEDEALLLRRHHYTWALMAAGGPSPAMSVEDWLADDPDLDPALAAELARDTDEAAQMEAWRYQASMEALFAKLLRAAGIDPDDGWEPGVVRS